MSKCYSHLVIPDTQVKPGSKTKHLKAAGNLAADKKPDRIVCLGDWWDMPTLNRHKTKKELEGARYEEDIIAGNKAMEIFLEPIIKVRKTKAGKSWNPKLFFILGNHEESILRHVESNPALEGKLGIKDLYLDAWNVYDFLDVVDIDGVNYSHFFYNQMTGKPIDGTVNHMLDKVGFSFTQGHKQGLHLGRKELANGQSLQGMIAGSYYLHDETYKGPQGNGHFRGLIYKHNVRDGNYDYETWNIDRVLKEYG